MRGSGYESWFISARDPDSPRALWIPHTRHRPAQGPESVALWCTVLDGEMVRPPVVVKEVFNAFPADAAAGPGRFRGQGTMAEHRARWDLAITGEQAPLRPLHPPVLYRAPVAVTYADPRGGSRTVRHAAPARFELTVRRPGNPELTLSSTRGAYEYGTRQPMPGIVPQPLPEG
jgi:hypothetical protein